MMKLSSLISEKYKRYSTAHSDLIAIKHRASWAIDTEPWRGPHAGAELHLMLQNKKPITSLSVPAEIEKFKPYIKSRRFIAKKTDIGMLIAQPNEAWRIKKIEDLFNISSEEVNKSPRSRFLYHAKLGLLFGYSKEDILKFIKA